MLKISFLHSVVYKVCKIGIRLLNSVKPVGLDWKWYQWCIGVAKLATPVPQQSWLRGRQGKQMANSGNTRLRQGYRRAGKNRLSGGLWFKS
ncbi:MAG: hypothetical protein A3J55_03840 [Candidatus Ryanbacteria bacterium RIFCSPHIGHO2_02_FULL_45_17b]|nr:MAG: hypothetical protein A3J55_03840 [Candidatus Ryanbacteria bacterium RIFCSPHIGHO2_02_FULL_45_17b]